MTTETRRITVLNVTPVHPGRGEPSHIEMCLVLEHLKARPVVCVRITSEQAIRLIEQLALAVRVTSPTLALA